MLPLHTGISFGPVYEGPPKLTTAPNPDFPNCIVRSSLRDRYVAVVPADWSLRSFSIKAIARDIAGRSHENVKLQDFCRFYRKQLQHVRVEVLAEIEKAAQAYPQRGHKFADFDEPVVIPFWTILFQPFICQRSAIYDLSRHDDRTCRVLLNVLLSESSNGEEIGEESRKLALRTLTLCSSPKNVPAVPYYQLEQLEPKLLAFRSLFELAENLVVLKLLEFCNDALLKTIGKHCGKLEELTIASHNERRSPEHTSKTEDALGYGLTAHGIREFFTLHSERHDTLEFLDISRLEEYKYENRISFRILESLSLLSKLNTVWFNLNLFNAASESASRPIQLNWPAGMEPRSDSCVTSVRIHASCWDTARNGDPLVVYFRRYFPNASEVFFEGWGGKNEDNLRTMLMEKEVKTKPKFVLPGFMKIGSKKITCFSSGEFGSLRLLSADGIGSDLLDTLLEVEEVRLSGLTPAFRFPLPDPVVVINFTIGLKRLVLEGGPEDSLPFSLVTDILKFCLDLRELYVWCKHISGASDDKLSQVLERRWLVANNRLEVFYLASVVEKVNLTEASVNLVLRQCTESLSCLGLITTWNVVSLDSDRISIENDVFVARSCDYSVKPYEKPDPLDHVSNLFHHL